MSYREPSTADLFASYSGNKFYPFDTPPAKDLGETADSARWWDELRPNDDASNPCIWGKNHRLEACATVLPGSPKISYPTPNYPKEYTVVETDYGLFVSKKA